MKKIGEKCQEVIDKLLKDAPAQWRGCICAGAVLNRTTGDSGRGYLAGTICHSWLPGCYGYGAEKGNDCLVFNTTKNIESDAQRAFAKWVVQDSPYAYGVLNRDNLDQIYHGGMVVDIDLVGTGGALWICKAMRYIYESPLRVEQFGRLVEKGLPPKAAFFVCSSYGSYHGSRSSSSSEKQNAVASHCDHNQVQANMSKDMFIAAYKVVKGPKNNDSFTNKMLTGQYLHGEAGDWLGFGGSKTERVPDGWGGFTEKKVPANEDTSIITLLAFLNENGLV